MATAFTAMSCSMSSGCTRVKSHGQPYTCLYRLPCMGTWRVRALGSASILAAPLMTCVCVLLMRVILQCQSLRRG